jgi:hypothetical protein
MASADATISVFGIVTKKKCVFLRIPGSHPAMPQRSIRAFCPRCRHQQPFVRARFDWKLHVVLTVLTLGVWAICLLSSAIKRALFPWRCEHCGWHQPDFRSPGERSAGNPPRRRPASGSWRRSSDGSVTSTGKTPNPSDKRPPAA